MAYQLSDRAKRLLEQRSKTINLIVEIEGIPVIYSSVGLEQAVRVGMQGLKIGNDWVIGGRYQADNNRDAISFKDGTTKRLSQQIQEDKSASTSVKSMNIALVDKDFQVSEEILSEKFVNEILNRRCDIYLGLVGDTSHPEDSVQIFAGNISDVTLSSGLVKLLVQAPETLKRQEVIPQVKTALAAALDGVSDVVFLEDVSDLIQIGSGIDTYIRINDEIIRYEGINYGNNSVYGCARGQLNTLVSTHDIEDDVESMYALYGDPLEMVLSLLTGGPKPYPTYSKIDKIDGERIYFTEPDAIRKQGATVGDQIRVKGSTVGDTGLVTIQEIGDDNGQGFVAVGEDLGSFLFLVDEQGEIFSKYRVSNYGAGIEVSQIDVEQFEYIKTVFGAAFPEIRIYVKDNLELQPFIDEILYSIGAISLERKGRISITYTAPPLATTETKILTDKDIVKPEQIKSLRSDNIRFYNTVEYSYDEFSLTEDRQRKNVRISADSLARVKIGRKVLHIDARGLRSNARDFIEAQSRRFLDRYKFGAEALDIQVTFGFGFALEVGDVILFAPDNLRIWDYVTKSYNFRPRMMEVINKTVDYTTGAISLKIADTSFGTNIRFSTIGPASYLETGSTTESLKLKRLITTPATSDETYKWENFVSSKIRVRNEDFTQSALVELIELDPADDTRITISPLPFAPLADMIVDFPDYEDCDDVQKALHGFISPISEITSVASQIVFDVADGSKFFVNSLIDIYNDDYSVSEERFVVENVTGNTITINRFPKITITPGLNIGRIGFISDKGDAYGYY